METKVNVFLPLSQGKVAVIDFEDFEKVRGLKWSAQKIGRRFYARRNVRTPQRAVVYLHRAITDCPPDREVNHINGDGLDNRQENLQICTGQQNSFTFQRKRKNTSSKYRGVSWDKRNKCWLAKIKHSGKNIHIGCFHNEEAAARAYDAAAIKFFGEYASPNFSKEISNAP